MYAVVASLSKLIMDVLCCSRSPKIGFHWLWSSWNHIHWSPSRDYKNPDEINGFFCCYSLISFVLWSLGKLCFRRLKDHFERLKTSIIQLLKTNASTLTFTWEQLFLRYCQVLLLYVISMYTSRFSKLLFLYIYSD